LSYARQSRNDNGFRPLFQGKRKPVTGWSRA